jgi:cytochrome c-type biogenesis protein CcmH/NrfG
MTVINTFWFSAGLMTALAALALVLPISRKLGSTSPSWERAGAFLAVVVVVIGASLTLYRWWGQPDALSGSPRAAFAGSAHNDASSVDTVRAGSVEDATAKLAQRLGTQSGSAADWNLLAQSYDFLNRPADAAEARKHAQNADAPAPPAAKPNPKFVSLVQKAEKLRAARDYAKATDAYREAAAAGELNADEWADYADAAASAGDGKLQGAAVAYIDRALKLEPEHPKALWLKASALHDAGRFAEAIDVWQHLQRALPENSPDAKIVAQNIAEDQQLSGQAASPNSADEARPAIISGTVDIDPALKARAASGSTLFVFAQSLDSPGPPLAVMRLSVGDWPVRFTLSDAQAMLPERRLSSFQNVKIEARISSHGQPLAQSGDLQGASAKLNARDGTQVHILIDKIIG